MKIVVERCEPCNCGEPLRSPTTFNLTGGAVMCSTKSTNQQFHFAWFDYVENFDK